MTDMIGLSKISDRTRISTANRRYNLIGLRKCALQGAAYTGLLRYHFVPHNSEAAHPTVPTPRRPGERKDREWNVVYTPGSWVSSKVKSHGKRSARRCEL